MGRKAKQREWRSRANAHVRSKLDPVHLRERSLWLPSDMEMQEQEQRRAIFRRAEGGDVTAQVELWRIYHCRLPLVEQRTGWRPGR